MKPTYKVKNAQIVKVMHHWPHLKDTENAHRLVMICQSDGPCDERYLKDGHEIRTSLIENIRENGTKVETVNSIYEVSNYVQ